MAVKTPPKNSTQIVATPDQNTKVSSSNFTQALELLACTLAIYIIYLTYGLYNEKITRVAYGDERFKFSLFLTTLQCFSSSIWALILITFEAFRLSRQHPSSYEPIHSRIINLVFDQVPKTQYVIIASSYSLSMLSSTAALGYLSFLIQALAKSSKLIPVMIGKIIRGHKYSLREYFHVALITCGILVFIIDPTKTSSAETSAIGILLIIFSLSMDSITGPTQDIINEKYKPNLSSMTFWINILPAMAFFLASIVTGEWNRALSFVQRHPEIKFEIGIYCFLAAIGQTAILIALFKFNSLTLTIITTTRKFITILASVFWFGHSLHLPQWIGVIMVFGGIGADSHLKYMKKKSQHRQNNKEAQAISDKKDDNDELSGVKHRAKSPTRSSPKMTKKGEIGNNGKPKKTVKDDEITEIKPKRAYNRKSISNNDDINDDNEPLKRQRSTSRSRSTKKNSDSEGNEEPKIRKSQSKSPKNTSKSPSRNSPKDGPRVSRSVGRKSAVAEAEDESIMKSRKTASR
jgi:UDP-galactose transporter B1